MSSYLRRFGATLAKKHGWKCHWCGIAIYVNGGPFDKATVDHLKPRSVGGTNSLDNLVLACRVCNGSRPEGQVANRYTPHFKGTP